MSLNDLWLFRMVPFNFTMYSKDRAKKAKIKVDGDQWLEVAQRVMTIYGLSFILTGHRRPRSVAGRNQ
jgi:hypothetical protein